MPAQASRLRRILGTAPLHEGIGLNFVTNRFYTRAPGSGANNAPFTTLFPFTGGAQSYYRGSNGLLVASVLNTPRIEYDQGGNVLGFLSEAARTNQILQSRDQTNAAWVKTTMTAAQTQTGADGVANSASLLTATGANATSLQTIVQAAVSSTVSFDIKRVTGSGVIGICQDGVTFTDVTAQTNSSTYSRVTLVASQLNPILGIRLVTSGDAIAVDFAGFEAGAFASSRIPTTAAPIARTADVSTRTLGAEFSATQGTVVVTGRASPGQDATLNHVLWSFDDGTAANRIQFRRTPAADTAQFLGLVASVQQFSLTGTYSNSTNFKEASAWALNDFSLSFNGAAPTTTGAGTLPTMTALGLGNFTSASHANGHIKTFDYYPTRLDNATLQRLST